MSKKLFSDVDSFDSGLSSDMSDLLERRKSGNIKGNVLNVPSEPYKFEDGIPLVGKFIGTKQITNAKEKDEGRRTFMTFIFEHAYNKLHFSLTGKMFENMLKDKTLIEGNIYIIDPPIVKIWQGKQYKDFPVTDVTEEFK